MIKNILAATFFLTVSVAIAKPVKTKAVNTKRKPAQVQVAQAAPSTLVLVGQIPGRYFADTDSHSYVLGYVEMKDRVIQKMGKIQEDQIEGLVQGQSKQVLKLKRTGSTTYDIIYPGLINLHNHTKQNNLPVWDDAQGQFANRFEWREFPNYKHAVSGNMNPWVTYARAIECATYRWSELSALVLGTTYLQGPSSCVENFGIQRVEDASAYVSAKAAVQAPTDLVIPQDMEFVWAELGPVIRTGKTYEYALAEAIKKYCPAIVVTEQNINSPDMLKVLKDQKYLVEQCVTEGLPNRFIRYVYWVHPTIAGRKNYFNSTTRKPSALIAHLAEGRRDDAYNQKEYEILKLFGLDLPNVNLVHGVGIPAKDYPELASKNIGLIWSPFSNLILYSQTLDIAAAYKAGVNLALGSDWVPTGTKSVLEEVKIARNYILKDVDKEDLVNTFSGGTGKVEKIDEELYKMMTENPAKMINHYEIKAGPVTKANPSGYAEAAVGRLAEGAMGSMIVVSHHNANPYTNLVVHASEKDINLVVIDGKPVYGNKSYLDQLGYQGRYELMPVDSEDHSTVVLKHEIAQPTEPDPENRLQFLAALIRSFSGTEFKPQDKCGFAEVKALVTTNSVEANADMRSFRDATGMDLDKVHDITRVLAINIMTQSRNKTDPKEGKPEYALKYFPALYSCNDANHTRRITNFIKLDGSDDFEANRKYRTQVIERDRLGRIPQQLADKYK